MFWIGAPGALVRFPVRTFDVSPVNTRQLVQTLGGKIRQVPLGFRSPRVWNLALGDSQGLPLDEVSAIRSVVELDTVSVFAEHALLTNLFTPAQARFEGDQGAWTRSDTSLGWAGWRISGSGDYDFPPVVVRPGLALVFRCPMGGGGTVQVRFLDSSKAFLSSVSGAVSAGYAEASFTTPAGCAFVQVRISTTSPIGAPVMASSISGFREGDGMGECILDFPTWAQPWRTDVPFLTSNFTLREVSGA